MNNWIKGLVNNQNEDNKCFRWYLVRYLNLVDQNPTKIRSIDWEFPKKFDFKGVKVTFQKKVYEKNVRKITISVYDYENKKPFCIYASKQTSKAC